MKEKWNPFKIVFEGRKKRGHEERGEGKIPKNASWNESDAFSRSPIERARVNESWQNCAKTSSLPFMYGLQFEKSIIIPTEVTRDINTCDAPSAGIKVTRPHNIRVEINLGICRSTIEQRAGQV